jgi:hypothetical protein
MNQLEKIIQSQLIENKQEKQQLEQIKDKINQNLIKIKDTITKQKFTDENINVNYKKLIFSAKRDIFYNTLSVFEVKIQVYKSRISKTVLITLSNKNEELYEEITVNDTENTIEFSALNKTKTIKELKHINMMLEKILEEQ